MEDRHRLRLMMAFIAAAVAARLVALTFLRPLNFDEIEFFRASDWVRRGLVPFRDFWEHHTPLQWLLFAPVTALTSSAGAGAILLMRWAQVPLWIATFWLIDVWMRNAGMSRFARWAAMGIALCSSLFMLPAIEFRVDVLGCFCFVAGLVLLQRSESVWAGVAFCLAGWANLRLGPLLAVTVLLLLVMRPKRGALVIAGVIAAFAAALLYFAATGSLEPLYRQAWQELYLGNRYAINYRGAFLLRMLAPFGLHLTGEFEPAAFDLGGVVVYIAGSWGVLRALRRFRQRDELFTLAILQIANIVFIWAMKSIHNYHFLLAIVLMIPFIAEIIDAYAWKNAAVAVVAAAAIVSGAAGLLRGKELDLHYQDLIMREADRRTPANAKIWDGVGWALRREPAYRYWFLPELPRQLEAHGDIERFDVAEFVRAAPAAVITDLNAVAWIRAHPQLQSYLTAHYIPVWRNLWMPGMSAVARPRAAWLVPADGRYRVIASAKLAAHPWFRLSRVDVGTYDRANAKRLEMRLADYDDPQPVRFTVDGQPIAPEGGRLTLKRGQHLIADAAAPAALLLIPGDDDVLFRQPSGGATLDGSARPVTHIPDLDFRRR